jgi:hypothetical protein
MKDRTDIPAPNTWREHLQHAIDDAEARYPMGIGRQFSIIDSASRTADTFSAMIDVDGMRFAIVVNESRMIVRPCFPAPVRSVRKRELMPTGRAYAMADAVQSIGEQLDIIA